ncbi:KaiC domain-containing protein [Archaeoglobales archaeon ex4484_92]|nr:MAG: KaiC domain-containing protein [Archaeoglobales archaeon ex4484_92]
MKNYYKLKDFETRAPKFFGVPTGTKLDEMFFRIDRINGNFVKKPIGGIPYLAVMNITGIPDSGKTILAEQFAIKQASSGYRVLFVTVENPANFLYSSLKYKSEVLGADFPRVEENIYIIDITEREDLRKNPRALIELMSQVIKENKISNTIIDSITGLYEHREVMARLIVRQFYNFLKKYKQTGIFVSQKRSSQLSESAEAAGGLAVAHIVDGTIVLDKKLIESRWDVNLYGLELGSILRTIRIDGCRICGHDSRTWVFEITELGIIRIISPLNEFIKKRFRRLNE